MDLFSTSYIFWGFVAVALAALVLGRIAANRDPRRAKQRARRAKVRQHALEENLARLPDAARRDLENLVAHRRTIEAIKRCRAELTIGLRDAKDVVDRLKRRD